MHILHLIKTSEGAAWALQLIERICEIYPSRFSFTVALPKGGRYIDRYKKVCKNVVHMDYTLNHELLKNGKLLREIVEREKPDIIHSWFTQTTLYERVFLKKHKIPTLFQVVGPLHLESRLFKYGDIHSASSRNYWVATSKYIYNKYFSAGVAESKLFLNYALVDIEKLIEDTRRTTVRNLKQEFGIPNHYKIIGTASYIYPPKFYQKTGIKGHEYLLEAYEKLLEKRNDVVLIIAGKTFGNSLNYEQKLKKRAQKIDPQKIIFTGGYNHIYEIIPNFDLFIYLSQSENLGGVYESLLFKIPTIASNKGAIPELVIPGETGYLVDPQDSETIVENILAVLDSNNEDIIRRGKQRVLDTFNSEKIINNAVEIYQKVYSGLK